MGDFAMACHRLHNLVPLQSLCQHMFGSSKTEPFKVSLSKDFTKFQTKRYMMHNSWKRPLCNLRTTLALIWSEPLLSAYRIGGYCSICQQAENAQIRLHWCACWSGPTLSAKCIRAFSCVVHHKQTVQTSKTAFVTSCFAFLHTKLLWSKFFHFRIRVDGPLCWIRQSEQYLHCLPLRRVFCQTVHKKMNFRQKLDDLLSEWMHPLLPVWLGWFFF